MSILEDLLASVKGEVFQSLMTMNASLTGLSAMSFFILISVVLASSAAMLTVYIAPKASGSGVPELIGCLNGVDISSYLTFEILCVKSLGVVLAVAGSLVVGKEGPLAHIGAAVAILVMFAPIPWFKLDEFRTNQRYREFVAAGISAGVSAAFGAPIGGTLFAYELSGPSTFWNFKLIWRNFFCASIATFSLAVFYAIA
jgi:H+/Cl- antiporter ClcA